MTLTTVVVVYVDGTVEQFPLPPGMGPVMHPDRITLGTIEVERRQVRRWQRIVQELDDTPTEADAPVAVEVPAPVDMPQEASA